MKKHHTLLPLLALSIHAQSAIDNQEQAVATVLNSIQTHQLTTLSDECLTLIVSSEDKEKIEIDVHEKHDEKCGGDPATSPRLFSYIVNKADGSLATDAAQKNIPWDGEYHPISEKAAP